MRAARLPAAVVPETSPAARNLPRAVPADASLQKVGDAVLGYSVDRRRRPKLEPWRLNALARRKELSIVAAYRRTAGLAMGPDLGWAMVIGNLCRVLYDFVTVDSLQAEAAQIGRGRLDLPAVELAVHEIMGKAWGRYLLYRPDKAGSAIELTSVERDECRIVKIAAMDEPTAQLRRRKNREQMQRSRAAYAAPRKLAMGEIARLLGISRATLYRMLQRGEIAIAETVSVCGSIYSPLLTEDPNTESVSPGPVHGKCLTGAKETLR